MQREKRMFRKIILSLIFVFCLLPVNIFAVGLGEIEQTSGLNQPLDANIPLLSAGDLADYEVLGTLASNREFEKFGVDRVFFLNEIKFATKRNDNGEIVINLTTRNPVKEPFLNFVIALNWPNGRILREYTLLLDPPVFEEGGSSTIERTTTQQNTPPQNDSLQTTRPSQSQAETSSSSSNYETNESPTYSNVGGTSYQVQPNDTLWSISSRARPDRSVSIQQALVAIYRANPDAFANGNINNLLKGKILEIPDAQTMQDVPRRAALQDVVMQNRQWRSGGARKIVDRTGGSESSTRSGTGGSRLSLAAGDEEGDAQGYGSDTAELNEVRNELSRSQEEAATLQAENEALRARLADILDKAENTESDSVVNIDDTELAALGQGGDDNTEQSMDDQSDTEEFASETMGDSDMGDAESSTDETMEDDSQAEDSGMTDQEDISTDEDSTTSETNANEDTMTEESSSVPQMPKPEPKLSFVDEFLQNPTMLWGSIGGLVVLILLIVFWRMKKRMENDDFHDDLVASAGAGSMDTTETFELPDVGDDMLVELDMEEDEEFAGGNSGEAFDPLGEADIYIAYGKHEQAENILLEAIEDNPVRADLKVKLMECYAESDDRDKFETLAEEVFEAVDSEEWVDQVDSLRSQAWGDDEVESSDDDFDLPSTEDIFGDDEDSDLDIDLGGDDGSDDLDELGLDDSDDFGLDDGLDSDESDSDILDSDLLDSDTGIDDDLDNMDGLDELDLSDESSESEDDIGLSLDDLDDDDFSIDMDADDDQELSLDSDDMDDADDISLDIDDDFAFDDGEGDDMDFDENLGEDSDEIATKLDLARAYVDMGDSDGAKEILKEVISEGTEEQKSEAQTLIDSVN